MDAESAYNSLYHQPFAPWAVGAVVLLLLLVRGAAFPAGTPRTPGKGFLGASLFLFQVAIMIDAGLASPLSPLAQGSALATAGSIVFVIFGDLRYFVLLGRFGHPEGHRARYWLALPLAAAFIVPVLSNATRGLWGENLRALFLAYELMFLTLAVAVRAFLSRRLSSQFATRLTHYEIAQYALWAGSDILILAGVEAGFLLRILPNLMYYAGFVPFAWYAAPAELKS